MVSVTKLVIFFSVLYLVDANFTRISRKNVLLSRRRRYLNFPMGSNFVMTLSHIKFLLQVQPRGWAILLEADVPFALPSDTRQFKKIKRHITDRKNLLEQVTTVLTRIGLDGESCTKKIICTSLQNKAMKGKSLVGDLLYAAFIYPEDGFDTHKNMCHDSFEDCPLTFLEYI